MSSNISGVMIFVSFAALAAQYAPLEIRKYYKRRRKLFFSYDIFIHLLLCTQYLRDTILLIQEKVTVQNVIHFREISMKLPIVAQWRSQLHPQSKVKSCVQLTSSRTNRVGRLGYFSICVEMNISFKSLSTKRDIWTNISRQKSTKNIILGK